MAKKEYGPDFYSNQAENAYKSALATLPFIINLLKPKSVVDLGCGIAPWLKACVDLGVSDVLGIEGEYVKELKTYIPIENYKFFNLEKRLTINRHFDLALSLEVGEHLSKDASQNLVDSLCGLSDIILFSAAIIGQEGTMHINEQFPEYWAKLFKLNNYLPVDYIRPLIWDDSKVEVWYKQNILIYVNGNKLDLLPEELQRSRQETHDNYLFRVHPALYLSILKRKYPLRYVNYWWGRFKRSLKKY